MKSYGKRFSLTLCLILLVASFIALGVVFANGEGGRNGAGGVERAGEVVEGAVDEAGQDVPIPATIADAFIGEELDYKIGFWFFDQVAVGKLTFKKGEDGGYEATLKAHATGIVDKLLNRRRDKYTSYMYLSEDGAMFLTRRFERVIETRDKRRVKKKYVDYKNRILTWISWEEGEDGKEEKWDAVGFPREVFPVDPLAAFYNFRAGAYGPLKHGGEYRIPALPRDGRVPEIYFRIITPEEMAKRKKKGSRYIADALIGKDLFGSEKGEMEIFFDSAFVPVYAVAKGVDYLGNVRGTLVAPEAKTVLKTAGPPAPRDPAMGASSQ